MEIWKDIKGYEELYQVSDLGRVRSFKSGKWQTLKNRLTPRGYYLVTLYKDGKATNKWVHKLVAQAFIPNPDNLPQVNHKDEDKLNNAASNLEWCTAKYNINYSSAKPIICVETGVVYHSLTEVSEKYNIQLALLSRVCNKDNYRAGGFHWKSL